MNYRCKAWVSKAGKSLIFVQVSLDWPSMEVFHLMGQVLLRRPLLAHTDFFLAGERHRHPKEIFQLLDCWCAHYRWVFLNRASQAQPKTPGNISSVWPAISDLRVSSGWNNWFEHWFETRGKKSHASSPTQAGHPSHSSCGTCSRSQLRHLLAEQLWENLNTWMSPFANQILKVIRWSHMEIADFFKFSTKITMYHVKLPHFLTHKSAHSNTYLKECLLERKQSKMKDSSEWLEK